MTQSVTTLPDDARLLDAALMIRRTGKRHVPIVSAVDGKLLGGLLTGKRSGRFHQHRFQFHRFLLRLSVDYLHRLPVISEFLATIQTNYVSARSLCCRIAPLSALLRDRKTVVRVPAAEQH